MEKRLFRSKNDRKLGGVCGGFAEYLDIDSTAMRILWVFLTLAYGFGFLLYLACLFIMPSEKKSKYSLLESQETSDEGSIQNEG